MRCAGVREGERGVTTRRETRRTEGGHPAPAMEARGAVRPGACAPMLSSRRRTLTRRIRSSASGAEVPLWWNDHPDDLPRRPVPGRSEHPPGRNGPVVADQVPAGIGHDTAVVRRMTTGFGCSTRRWRADARNRNAHRCMARLDIGARRCRPSRRPRGSAGVQAVPPHIRTTGPCDLRRSP